MAKHYLKNPFVSVDGHDISVYVKSVEVDRKKDELDTTASGDGGHTQIPGLSKDSFTLNLYQDKDFSILDPSSPTSTRRKPPSWWRRASRGRS